MMEALVTVMIVFVCLDFVVRLTFLRPAYMLATAFACALFTGLMCPVAADQTTTALSGFISDRALMLDTAVLLSVDILSGITFCWLSVMKMDGNIGGLRQKMLLCFTAYFPGTTIFLVLFYFLLKTVFSFHGVPFALLGWGLATAVMAAIPLLVFIVRRIIPRDRGRLDLLFMAYVLTAMAGVMVTV